MKRVLGLIALMSLAAVIFVSGTALSHPEVSPTGPVGHPSGLRVNGLVHLTDRDAPRQDSLEAEITFRKNGVPLAGAEVKLNGMTMQEKPGGRYEVDSVPFPISRGRQIRINLEPKAGPILSEIQSELIAAVTIANMIRYVEPRPGARLDIAHRRLVSFRWDFVGPGKKSQVRIYDTANNQIIFQQIVPGNQVNVPVNIFKPGHTYRVYQLVHDFDRFTLGRGLLPGSKVELGYAYSMTFHTD